jgi:hypothetical protein
MNVLLEKRGTVKAKGRDKEERTFHWRYQVIELLNGLTVHELIARLTPVDEGECFQLTTRELDEETLRARTITHSKHPDFSATGVTDASIIKLAELSKRKVRSSHEQTTDNPGDGRNNDATKVWKRLVKNKMAEYNAEEDYYQTTL